MPLLYYKKYNRSNSQNGPDKICLRRMYIIEVIPLIILPSNVPQLLSYFFNKNLEKGVVVEIPFGSRKVHAAVIASTPLEDSKISLKKSGFQLKKVSTVVNEIPQISNNQFKIALWISRHYFAPLGYCLKTVLPPFFLKKGYDTNQDKEQKREISIRKPIFILSHAKETLANLAPFIKKSVEEIGQIAFIIPDTSSLQYFYENLSLKYDVAKIHSGLNNKKTYESWKKIESGQADIILGTRQALFSPFKKLGLVVVDDVLHEFYKSDMTPKYYTPDLAKVVADIHGTKIIFTSNITGIENYYHLKNKESELLDKTKLREPLKVVNMVDEIKEGNFSVLSRTIKNEILSLINHSGQGKKILIFSPRRGHSGVLVCQSCGHAVKCKDCGTAFKIHRTTNFILTCHRCSRSIKIPDKCPGCNGFRLKSVGPAGTQKIYDEIQKILMVNNVKVPVLILDSDVVKNETEEEEIIQEMRSSKTSIIISTQMIFSHRYSLSFDLIGVLNTESLVSVPDFRAEERLFYQIEKLLDFLPTEKNNRSKNMILQTYNPENQAILTASNGDYKNFYNKELETRKIFSYPPYSQLVKLSFKHKNRDKASYEARVLSEKLKMALGQLKLGQKIKLTDSYPSFAEKERSLFVYNILLKILPEIENLKDFLKFIPSNWSIDVDPRSII